MNVLIAKVVVFFYAGRIKCAAYDIWTNFQNPACMQWKT